MYLLLMPLEKAGACKADRSSLSPVSVSVPAPVSAPVPVR